MAVWLPLPFSLRYNTATSKKEEGDGSRCCRHLLRCVTVQQEKKKKKKATAASLPSPSSCFYSIARKKKKKKKEKGLPGSRVGPAPTASSKLWQLSSKLQLLLQAPARSRSTFLELWRWSEIGGR